MRGVTKPRVGTVCFSTEQGLGRLAKSFFDAGLVTDPVPISHGRRPDHPHWYPEHPHVSSLKEGKGASEIRARLSVCDAVLFFETPFDWELIAFLRDRGVKTALTVMYECTPAELPAEPDVIICPSLLDLDYYPRGVYLPVPVDDAVRLSWRLRRRAEVFVHNSGWGGLKGRNGTAQFCEAMALVKSKARFIVRSQCPVSLPVTPMYHVTGTVPHAELYAEGDVFVFPERFNGLSLPLQEAFASGMPCLATLRHPMCHWLPNDLLVRPSRFETTRVSPRCNSFVEARPDPADLAAKIDELYGTDISGYSLAGREWAEQNSWERLTPRYVEVLS